jgi:hypothetical protein
MHEPLLALAALPAPARVCGIPLRHYSLGHELFLIREHSAFFFGGHVLPGDLLQAIWICASDYEGCQRSQDSWLYLPKLWLLRRAVERSVKRKIFDREVAAFREYRESGCLEFPLSDVVRPGAPTPRSPGTPFILRLQQFLMVTLRMGEAEAWDYPVGMAKMRWAAHWEQEAGLEVYNEDNAEMDRQMNEATPPAEPKGGEK